MARKKVKKNRKKFSSGAAAPKENLSENIEPQKNNKIEALEEKKEVGKKKVLEDEKNQNMAKFELKNDENRLRVKKYREKLKSKGFKQISFFISSGAYSKLQYLKTSKNKSYADIIEALINKEYYRIAGKRAN